MMLAGCCYKVDRIYDKSIRKYSNHIHILKGSAPAAAPKNTELS